MDALVLFWLVVFALVAVIAIVALAAAIKASVKRRRQVREGLRASPTPSVREGIGWVVGVLALLVFLRLLVPIVEMVG